MSYRKEDYIKILFYIICSTRTFPRIKFPVGFFDDYANMFLYLQERQEDLPSWEYMSTTYNLEKYEGEMTLQDTVESLNTLYAEQEITKTFQNIQKDRKNSSNLSDTLEKAVENLREIQKIYLDEHLFDLHDEPALANEYESFLKTYSFYPSGFKQIDETCEYMPGTINLIIGGTGGGKSLTAAKIQATLVKANVSNTLMSMEMGYIQCLNRLLTAMQVFPYNVLKKRLIKQEDYLEAVRNLNLEFGNKNTRFLTRKTSKEAMNIQMIEKHCKEFTPKVFIVDYFQLLDENQGWDANPSLMGRLKRIAQQHDTCFIVLGQASPDAAKNRRIPEKEDIALNSGVSRDADTMVGLLGEKYQSGTNKISYAVRKNRDGELAEFVYLVEPNLGNWQDATHLELNSNDHRNFKNNN